MLQSDGQFSPSGYIYRSSQRRRPLTRDLCRFAIVVALLIIGTWIIFINGGTGYAYPYLLLIPIILSAVWYGYWGSILCSIIAGLFLGPLMPLDTLNNRPQEIQNWLARMAFLFAIGVFTSWLFQSLRAVNKRHLNALKIDPETGLRNQFALSQDLTNALSRSLKETHERACVAVVLLRLTDLWEILQTLGAKASEQVVGNVAHNIHENLGNSHDIYRFSKSELAVLLFNPSKVNLDQIACKARELGEQESVVDGIPLRVQIVAGSYLIGDERIGAETALNRARTGLSAAIEDQAFYRHYDPGFDEKTAERVKLIAKVREGLRNNEFTLFHQPKICLRTGEVVGSEALLRWFEANGTLVMPGIFMPKLESTTLIDLVTRFVVEETCKTMREEKLKPVSINFAIRNLMDDSLIEEIGTIVTSSGLSSNAIEIEITEGALIQDPAKAKSAVESLRAQGFTVSLDDFGTGYSSFQYLSHLPLSGLKIDRAFVTHLETSSDARTIMDSMITMARALKLRVTVEGIETEAQRRIVTDLGADLAQGFFFSKPLPVSEYKKLLSE